VDRQIDFNRFYTLMHQAHGFDLSKYKETRIKRRTLQFMSRRKLQSLRDLVLFLQHKEHLEAFLRFHRINVSYFLRDKELFQRLITLISRAPAVLEQGVLSLACSKGEELYTLLFLLQEKGLPLPKTIIGVDADAEALLMAEKGIWDKDSLIEPIDPLLQRYLVAISDSERELFALKHSLAVPIQFLCMDILEQDLRRLNPPFGVLLCRNFIIYLEKDFRNRFINGLISLLQPKGLLFLGASEFINQPGSCNLRYLEHSIYQKVS